MPVKPSALSRFALFRNLTSRELEDVAALFIFDKVPADRELIREGAQKTALYVLLEGSVVTLKTDASGRQHEVDTLRSPSIFGELDVLALRGATLGVRTLEKVAFGALSHQAMKALCDSASPGIAKVLQNLAAAMRWRNSVFDAHTMGVSKRRNRQDLPQQLGAVRRILYSGWDVRRPV